MADGVAVTAGVGTNIVADEIVSPYGGATAQAQGFKLVDGTVNGTGVAVVSNGGLNISDPDQVATGTISATDAVVAAPGGAGALLSGASTAGSYVFVAAPGGDAAWNVQLTGTFGGGSVYYEGSLDSTNGADGNWIALNGRQTGIVNTVLATGTTTAGVFRGNTSGLKYFRVRIVGATTPSVAVQIRLSGGTGAIFLNASIPGGTNAIGTVDTELPAAAALADATANPTVPGVGALGLVWNGTTWDRLRGSIINARTALDVNLAGSTSSMAAITGTISAADVSTTGTAITSGKIVGSVASAGNIGVTINTSAFVGTLVFEASDDGGTNYFTYALARSDNSGVDQSVFISTAATLKRMWEAGVGPITHFQVRCSVFTSGTVAIRIGPGVQIYDSTPVVNVVDGSKPTYSMTLNSTNVASAVTNAVPLFELANPAASTRVLRLLRLFVQLTLATAGTTPLLQVMKTSTLSSGGTSVAQTALPHDSGSPAAQATGKLFTAIPTAGTAVAPVRTTRLFGVATVMTAQPSGVEWIFGGGRPAQAVVIRPGQTIAIMAQAAFATVPTITGDVEWTEE